MPLHPHAALAIQRAGDLPTDLSPAELRIAYERQRLTLLPEKPAMAVTFQLSIPSDYGPIPARFYRASKDKGPCPLLVYFHGGGFMLGSLALYDTTCRRLAVAGDCAVLSVDYRLAPETQFPGAVLDAYAATRWASDNAELLNIDPAKIAVGGDSAGGNLAGRGGADGAGFREFAVALQVLIYPMTDQSRDYPSYERNASGYMLTTAALHWFMDNYIPDPEDRKDPDGLAHAAPEPGRPAAGAGDQRRVRSAGGRERSLCQTADGGGRANRLCLLSRHDPSLLHLGRGGRGFRQGRSAVRRAMRKLA